MRRRWPTRCCTRRIARIQCRSFLDFIGGAGLTFSRWVRQAPYSPRCGVMARLPQASRIAALEPAQQYAAAELFRGTMTSHSVIVRRDDRAGRSQANQFFR